MSLSSSANAEPAVANASASAEITEGMKELKMAKGSGKQKQSQGQLADSVPLELSPPPAFLAHRIAMYDGIKKEYDAFVAAQPRSPIKITLPDGRGMDGTAWETTPMAIAKQISNSLADRLVIAKVNGELFDTLRPLERDCVLELLDFEHEEGRQVFWHSSAHVLGEACERHYGCHLCLGPPIEDGFYYEMGLPGGASVSQADYPALNTLARNAIKEKQPFERLVLTKEQLLEMFRDNPYKVRLIQEKIPDGTSSTVYRCGPLIDLCRGPHIPHTGRIKAFEVLKNSSSYFLGSAENDTLQRIYGISFPETAMMKEFLKFREEAEKRDHRKVGKDQQLFFFHDLSPGSCFFLPHGAKIYNKLVEFIRSEYRQRGFSEVISPNMFNVQLWHTSGHWQNYQENMFQLSVEKETFALKPMNCPGHCLMFKHRERSYRELPVRFADFGVLHRNELSGSLGGLTRVRRFCQDDAHIFCRPDQINDEIRGCLDFLQHVYGIFGFSFSLKLSTRPEKYLGELAVWDEAERQLAAALEEFNQPWELNPGDGAFYGPKIDITIMDAHKRRHQCATIQLDFQLPIRFDLEFRAAVGNASHGEENGQESGAVQQASSELVRPVIIHRAILGSLERMFAILVESFGQNWPFWLSPRQIMVVPVSHANDEYARAVQQRLFKAGFDAEADCSDLTLNKKIRNAETGFYTCIFVVGGKEAQDGTVNARKAGPEGVDVIISVEEAIGRLARLNDSKSGVNIL
jgi:threonyl-tRNA synthetase